MPLTCIFCIVGAASISAFPLFSGFISKSMIVSAAGHGHLVLIWLMLQFASAGVFHHAGIKVPFFIFFSHDAGLDAKEPPLNMLLAMGIAAGFCVFLGVFPQPLYSILPYPVDYMPYTGAHVMGQLQLLMFGALAFALLMLSGFYPPELRSINLDTDWFYILGGRGLYRLADKVLNGVNQAAEILFVHDLAGGAARFFRKAPTVLVLWAVMPVFRLTGISGKFLELKSREVRQKLSAEAAPIGLSAAAAVLMVVLMFLVT
jgi:multicomponent Na+:H+ antiporter subunit D